MKKNFTIVAMTLLWIVSLSAQVPQKLTYQAVIRDVVGNVITNQDLSVQISILQGSLEGPVVYSENHATSTTVNGVITLEVGGGKTSYDFTSIDWSNGPFYIRSTAELNGKSISVTSQLLSVPYALYAQRSFFANKVDEQFLEDIIAAKIQSALEERDAIWEDKMQNAMDERDAIWQGKIEALEATLDSISAQISASQADTIPTDTIPTGITDTIPTDTVHTDTTPADTVFKSAAINDVLPGKFSMGKNYQVHFSKGILQFHGEKKKIRFAKNQFDNPGRKYTDFCHYPPKAWIDHFEHGSLSEIACPCLSWDRDEALYGNGYNLDANAIEKIGEWDVPSISDWYYILSERERADSLYSKAEVAGVKGYVLLPDDWETPADLTFTPKTETCSGNVYDKKTWEKMEALGAVFMPCDRYWSWMLMGAFLNFSADHAYPIEKNYWDYENDFIVWDEYNCRSMNAYRLVVRDSIAVKIMSEEPTEKEEIEDEEDPSTPSTYLPEPADLSNVDMKAGLLHGKFSVSETKQVNFSQGNLQYNKNSKIWRFADNQYTHIQSTNWWGSQREITDDGWLDNFAWASSGFAYDPLQYFEYDESYGQCLETRDVAGTKFDWGVNNPIINGGNTPNIWRTPTKEEWEYLIGRKKDGIKLCFPGIVCGSRGLILLPDDWNFDPELPYTDTPNEEGNIPYDRNVYTEELWARMEAQGAVYLPCAGLVLTSHFWDIGDVGSDSWTEGSYWASSPSAMCIYVDSYDSVDQTFGYYYDVIYKVSGSRAKYGSSVRLVRDVTE
ncbi:MAG: hypothetical protein K6F48_00030 [Paludibacteraceae bacterium]|nr:hypothetical protein [Paludibacteraceae bacterium]